jgi:hypothetical protein
LLKSLRQGKLRQREHHPLDPGVTMKFSPERVLLIGLTALAISISGHLHGSPARSPGGSTALLPEWPPLTINMESYSLANLPQTHLAPWPDPESEVTLLTVPSDRWFVLTYYPLVFGFTSVILIERTTSGEERSKWGWHSQADSSYGFSSSGTQVGIPFRPGSQLVLRNLSQHSHHISTASIMGYYTDSARGVFSYHAVSNTQTGAGVTIAAGGSLELARTPPGVRLVLLHASLAGASLRTSSSAGDRSVGGIWTSSSNVISLPNGLAGSIIEEASVLYLINESNEAVEISGMLIGYFAPL